MNILLATDGSPSARAAVDFLRLFPLPDTTRVTVATVIAPILSNEQQERLPERRREAVAAVQDRAQSDGKRLLEVEVERLRQAGLAADARLCDGPPAAQIVRLAAELGSDVIALGSHGPSGPKRFLLGSVADRILAHPPCSVLLVRNPARAGAGQPGVPGPGESWRLLLAFDDSAPAGEAVALCAGLPLRDRATLEALTILPIIHMFRQDIRQHLSWLWQEKRQAAERALQRVAAEIGRSGAAVATRLRESPDVAQAILEDASAQGSHLLVFGHTGKAAFERFVMGSVASRLAHHAPCAVLAVHGRG